MNKMIVAVLVNRYKIDTDYAVQININIDLEYINIKLCIPTGKGKRLDYKPSVSKRSRQGGRTPDLLTVIRKRSCYPVGLTI